MKDENGMSTKQKIQSLVLLLFMVFINVFFVFFGAHIGSKGRIKELEDALYVKNAEQDKKLDALDKLLREDVEEYKRLSKEREDLEREREKRYEGLRKENKELKKQLEGERSKNNGEDKS